MIYVRFQGTTRGPRGLFPGVFWLVNHLAREGRLTEQQEAFRRENNAWYDTAYTTPTIYGDEPRAVAWFKSSAHELIDRVEGYLEILSAHEVGCERLESSAPGHVIYEDSHQVVVLAQDVVTPGK